MEDNMEIIENNLIWSAHQHRFENPPNAEFQYFSIVGSWPDIVKEPGALWMWKKTRDAGQLWDYKPLNRLFPSWDDASSDDGYGQNSLVSKLDGKVLSVDKSNWQVRMRSKWACINLIPIP